MLSLRNAVLGFGGPPLLAGAALEIQPGERLGLVGRNGCGKSTLLQILAGELALDAGELVRRPGLRVALLPQMVPDQLPGSVATILAAGCAANLEDWQRAARMDRVLGATGLDPAALFDDLSAGMKRRTLLARCMVAEPDLLLLDEPTNHLDLDSIRWLEAYLRGAACALLFVTHDRAFLQNLATRILDLERGRLSSWDCDYLGYLQRKEAWLAAEETQQAVFDKKLSQEEAWIRQGIKARRTRNEGRVRRLESMRAERRSRRERAGSVRLSTDTGNRSGNRVIRAEGISFAYAGKPVVRDFSAQIERGDKIGIVGPNGSGKTTLIRLLLGELQPQAGTVTHGTRLQVAYFDQLREQLDLAGTVQENIADGAETVAINGRRQHVISYLKDFLFPADRARSPVSMLSGGERNRLLLARLFTRPFNVLVMDEPTNDLDIETLELLEEMLADYQGTLLLVSHDRAFLDNVVTELLVLEGDGRIASLVGGYADYLQRRQPRPAAARAPAKTAAAAAPANKPRKLLNRERAALTALPGEIEALEQEQAALVARLASAEFHRQPAAAVAEARQRLVAIEAAIHEKFALWEELETLRSESDG